METIHLKTVDPFSQELLRSAALRGIELSWDRYKRQQPQDGFLRLGLSCPYGCMEGPCRIDPFGHGPDRGLCGLDRDGMSAAFFLRLSLLGVLEAVSDQMPEDTLSEKSWNSTLGERASRALEKMKGHPLTLRDIDRSALLLKRPAESPDRLIEQALRLGILTLVLSEIGRPSGRASKDSLCKAGYGLLSDGKIFIGVVGRPSQKLIASLAQKLSRETSPPVKLVSMGDWVPLKDRFLPCVCTSGEAELLISSGSIHLVLAGPKADPSILQLCRNLELPLVTADESPDSGEIFRLARRFYATTSQASLKADASLVGEGRVTSAIQELKSRFKKDVSAKVALLGGSDTLQQPLGYLPVELAAALRGEGHLVAAWGDAALWMIKNGFASEKDGSPVSILDARQGPLLAVTALAAVGKLKDLQGVCFTGLKDCHAFATAIGLASLGLRVSVAVPVPLWGSEKVRHLLTERLSVTGGSLTHFDHPGQVQEILEWFRG
jgi:hypothetical protein